MYYAQKGVFTYGVSYWSGVMIANLGASIALTFGATVGIGVVLILSLGVDYLLYKIGEYGDELYEKHKASIFG